MSDKVLEEIDQRFKQYETDIADGKITSPSGVGITLLLARSARSSFLFRQAFGLEEPEFSSPSIYNCPKCVNSVSEDKEGVELGTMDYPYQSVKCLDCLESFNVDVSKENYIEEYNKLVEKKEGDKMSPPFE